MFRKWFLFALLFCSIIQAGSEESHVIFTLPKSGTHLLKKIYKNLTNNEITHFHCHSHKDFSLSFFEEHYADKKICFAYRDPRDVLVSYVLWVDRLAQEENWNWMEACGHKEWMKWSIDRKLKEVLKGKKSPIMMMNVVFLPQLKELLSENPNAYVVCFEDLMGSGAGGDDAVQRKTIAEISHFILGYELPSKEVDRLIELSWGNSETFNDPKIGKWKTYFTPSLKRQFKKSLWNDALIFLGYESDNSW